jgi:hypothetical protein
LLKERILILNIYLLELSFLFIAPDTEKTAKHGIKKKHFDEHFS